MNQLETKIKLTFKGNKTDITHFPDFYIFPEVWIECKQRQKYFDFMQYKKTQQFQNIKKLKGFLLIFFSYHKEYILYDFSKKIKIKTNKFKKIKEHIEKHIRIKKSNRGRI